MFENRMIEIDLHTQHFFSEKIYAKQMKLPAGHFAVSHKHNYDHLSILSTGIAEVTTDTETRQYTAPACIDIKAGVEHKIVAITDVDWFCLHHTTETDVNKIDKVLIQGGV
jgi:quercetin dioxygenase-like cupin family protein